MLSIYDCVCMLYVWAPVPEYACRNQLCEAHSLLLPLHEFHALNTDH